MLELAACISSASPPPPGKVPMAPRCPVAVGIQELFIGGKSFLVYLELATSTFLPWNSLGVREESTERFQGNFKYLPSRKDRELRPGAHKRAGASPSSLSPGLAAPLGICPSLFAFPLLDHSCLSQYSALRSQLSSLRFSTKCLKRHRLATCLLSFCITLTLLSPGDTTAWQTSGFVLLMPQSSPYAAKVFPW